MMTYMMMCHSGCKLAWDELWWSIWWYVKIDVNWPEMTLWSWCHVVHNQILASWAPDSCSGGASMIINFKSWQHFFYPLKPGNSQYEVSISFDKENQTRKPTHGNQNTSKGSLTSFSSPFNCEKDFFVKSAQSSMLQRKDLKNYSKLVTCTRIEKR